MKKALMSILAFLLLLCLFSCDFFWTDDTGKTPYASDMLKKTVEHFELTYDAEIYASDGTIDGAMELDDDILNGKFGELMDYPELSTIKEYAVYFSNELYNEEFGFFLMESEDDVKAMKEYIDARMSRLRRNAVNYPSVDTSMIDAYIVESNGKWVWYAATKDNSYFGNVTGDFILKPGRKPD